MTNVSPMKHKKTHSPRTEKYTDSKAKRESYKAARHNKNVTRGLYV